MVATIVSIPATAIPHFDELYVISDLHLGGQPGFQIFDSGEALASLIEHLRLSAAKRVALVINGDFVDFLAEMPAKPFDPAGAVEKLDRIIRDPAFAKPWNALKKFAGAMDRYLVINLGNHDLELALPWVRSHLLQVLSNNDAATRGRITLAFDGTGFLCRVGDATILCVHGNEADDWNVADHERIRRIGRDIMQGRPVDSWIPNAGSQLVIEVMNNLKCHFPFVDLLKPEVEAVLPTLAALAPGESTKLSEIASLVRRLGWDKMRRATGFLDRGEKIAQETDGLPRGELSGSMEQQVGWLEGSFNVGSQAQAEAMLEEIEEHLAHDTDPLRLINGDQRGEYLGASKALYKLARRQETAEVLREALQGLRKDRSFEWDCEDATFRILDRQIGESAEFVVAGHTHLERALPRARGRGWYFNSGTWARLIKLETKVLEDAAEFRKIFRGFSQGTLADLDGMPDLVIRRLTVIAIWSEGGATHGELRHISSPPGPLLSPVPNSRFTRR
jgi:UDP-2,3-diacylglucosamine pyrophosphatase LpxH